MDRSEIVCDRTDCSLRGNYVYCLVDNSLRWNYRNCFFHNVPRVSQPFNSIEHFTLDEGQNTEDLIKHIRESQGT